MAILGTGNLTLADWGQRIDPLGKIAMLTEILSEDNEIIMDMIWREGNLPTGNKSFIRTALPTISKRQLNAGVAATKSATKPITDALSIFEAYSNVDVDLATLNGEDKNFRFSEDLAFIEGMNQSLADDLFYGNIITNPENMLGLAPRYNATTNDTYGEYILLGGGSGADNTSIWLIAWGDRTCFGMFPKGSKAGLQIEDLGKKLLNPGGEQYEAFITKFQWKAGLTVKDPRFIVRIANIDVSELTKDATSSSADLIDLMAQALELIKNTSTGKLAFYCNRTIKSYLRRQLTNKSTVLLSMDEAGGKPVMSFSGVPVRLNEAILNNEATIS